MVGREGRAGQNKKNMKKKMMMVMMKKMKTGSFLNHTSIHRTSTTVMLTISNRLACSGLFLASIHNPQDDWLDVLAYHPCFIMMAKDKPCDPGGGKGGGGGGGETGWKSVPARHNGGHNGGTLCRRC